MGTVGEFLALYNSQHYWCQRERSCKDIEKQAPGLMPYTNEHLT